MTDYKKLIMTDYKKELIVTEQLVDNKMSEETARGLAGICGYPQEHWRFYRGIIGYWNASHPNNIIKDLEPTNNNKYPTAAELVDAIVERLSEQVAYIGMLLRHAEEQKSYIHSEIWASLKWELKNRDQIDK